jgi:CelD/BcsL family acetyltransferase involved in cellulose biosynthesis
MADLEVRVERSFAALEHLRGLWDEAAVELGATIYMSYDWAKTWWQFYGGNKELRVFLFFVEQRLVGVVPLYIDRIGVWPFRLAVARLVCANIPPKAFQPPLHPDWADQIFQSILTRLFAEDRCDLLSFGPVSEEHGAAASLGKAARSEAALVGKVVERSEGVSSVFVLPNSLEAYFEALDKDERKKRKYELRVLKREPDVSEDVLSDPAQTAAEFEGFVRLHAQQWQGKGKLGHFGSWPQAEEFNRALVRTQGQLGRVRFVRVLAGQQVLSSQYAFSFGRSYYWELPARVVEPRWQRFSLGPAGFFALVDASIKEGKARVEAGLAHYDYKRKLNAREYQTQVVRIVARRLAARWRTALFTFLRWCLLWGYHKVWYNRVSPRLPARFRKPQWTLWLRLDF